MTQFQSCTLPNGLTVLAEVIPHAYSVSQGFFVNTGSRDESPSESGVSHFLEHMIFKGSQKRSVDDVNRLFDDWGASCNACTSEDMTIFYASFLPEFLERITELWADILRPALRESDFNSERKVVLEELKMYQDQPPYDMDEQSRNAFFNGHPLGNAVIGSVKSLSDMTPEIMRNYFKRQYAPNNITLCAAGKVDFDQLVRLAEKYCGQWESQSPLRKTQSFIPGKEYKRVYEPTATEEYILDWAPGPEPEGREFYIAKILAALVGDESGSRFYWELSDPGLAEIAQFSYADYSELGAFTASFACAPEEEKQCLDIVKNIYADIALNGFNNKELELCRQRELARMVVHEEKIASRMFTIAGDWCARKQYLSFEQEIEIIKSITLDEINALARKFPLTPAVRYAVGPQKTENA